MEDRQAFYEAIEERTVRHPEGWVEVIALKRWYWEALALLNERLGTTAEDILAQCEELLGKDDNEDLHSLFAYQVWNIWRVLDEDGAFSSESVPAEDGSELAEEAR